LHDERRRASLTQLPLPSGLAANAGVTGSDINDNGDILLRSNPKWWFKRASDTGYKTLDLTDYNVTNAVGIDAAGKVYLRATKKNGGTPKVIGLVVTL